MNQELRLPHNNKEGLLYGTVICGITALLMTVFNIVLHVQTFNSEVFFIILKLYPLFFVVAMLLENFVVSHFSHAMIAKFASKKDSFNAQILFNVLFTVLGMSLLMTVIGDFVGNGFVLKSGMVGRFLTAWPRNFSIVLGIELLIAQPIARKVMMMLHKKVVSTVEVD